MDRQTGSQLTNILLYFYMVIREKIEQLHQTEQKEGIYLIWLPTSSEFSKTNISRKFINFFEL